MEFKLFNEIPAHVGPEWHKTRQVADHINEPGQRERLLETLALIEGLIQKSASIADWGAGNGGLLHELGEHGYKDRWGYDLMPSNVDYAKSVYCEDVTLHDIVSSPEPSEVGICTILTETLEHLVKPHELLWRLRFAPRSRAMPHGCRFVIASSPAAETPENHYEFHLWAWTGESYRLMFERAGFKVLRHFVTAFNGTQFIVAENCVDKR